MPAKILSAGSISHNTQQAAIATYICFLTNFTGLQRTNIRPIIIAHLSSMEMFDVGPTLGASVAHLSSTEVPWVGSTSCATVANVSNIG